MKRRTDEILRYVGLVGKVDPCFDQRQRFNQPPPPSLGTIADHTFELPKCLSPLRRRFRGDQITKSFNGCEIEPPCFKGATGEFTRLSKTATRDGSERAEHTGDHRVAAV